MNKEELGKELEALKEEKEEYLNSWKRDLANYINYKNRECERTQDLIFSFKENIFEKIIPILDNMCLAERCVEDELKNNSSVKGLLMIKKQLEDFLKLEGIEEINDVNIDFDPEMHEVIKQVKAEGDSGKIIEVVQKGYKLNNKVLRPAKVKIIK